MSIQLLLQWHKLLHIIVPVIIILAFNKKIKLRTICIILLSLGFLKELSDVLIVYDPIMESVADYILNIIGVCIGAFIVRNSDPLTPRIDS